MPVLSRRRRPPPPACPSGARAQPVRACGRPGPQPIGRRAHWCRDRPPQRGRVPIRWRRPTRAQRSPPARPRYGDDRRSRTGHGSRCRNCSRTGLRRARSGTPPRDRRAGPRWRGPAHRRRADSPIRARTARASQATRAPERWATGDFLLVRSLGFVYVAPNRGERRDSARPGAQGSVARSRDRIGKTDQARRRLRCPMRGVRVWALRDCGAPVMRLPSLRCT